MEGDKSGKRKRRRDIGGDDEKIKTESGKGKKLPAQSVMMNSMDDNFQNNINDEIIGYEFRDAGIGVFDFPWIKEGLIFKADDYLEPEDNFGACPYQHDETFTEKLTDKLCAFPDGDLRDNKFDDESLWSSLQVDDLESVDRIWSCVIDQPLQINIGLR